MPSAGLTRHRDGSNWESYVAGLAGISVVLSRILKSGDSDYLPSLASNRVSDNTGAKHDRGRGQQTVVAFV